MTPTTTLAYKYVMTTLMIAFINYYAPRLHLPFKVPLDEHRVENIRVSKLICMEDASAYGVSYREGNYTISFNECHMIGYRSTGGFCLTKLEDDGKTSFGISLLEPGESANSLMERASRMKYVVVDTNDLYRIATNYLVALEIDPKTLETSVPLSLDEYADFHSIRGVVPSPLMYAMWGNAEPRNPGANGISLEISAVSGELLELNAGINTCKGFPLIKDLDKLQAISDEEFLKYSPLERSNLVIRFAAVQNPALDKPSLAATNSLSPAPSKVNSGGNRN